MGIFGKKKKSEPFQFRISDAVQVPLRGYLLRLKLVEGSPALGDVSPGRKLRVQVPGGAAHDIAIKDFAVTGGSQSQERLERTRELDIVVDASDALLDGREIDIGWMVNGPVTE